MEAEFEEFLEEEPSMDDEDNFAEEIEEMDLD